MTAQAKAPVSTFDVRLLDAMRKAAPLNLDKCEELADQFNAKVKSIIAKAIREGIEYQKLERVRKDGKPVASKNDSVSRIEQRLGIDEGSLVGLEKASKAALERLRDALNA